MMIIFDPIPFDFDNSRGIDLKEAFILGLALSLDSICVGIGSSIGGFFSFSFPIFVAIFQVTFLNVGTFLGKKIATKFEISETYLKFLSGLFLIIFAIIK